MSELLIVAIEGVLTKIDEELPVADPNLHGVQLVQVLSARWPVGYVTSAPAPVARAWLRDSPAPEGLFVVSCEPEKRTEAILGELGRRGDRARLFLTGSTDNFATLLGNGVSTLLYRHESFLTSDWRMKSSWIWSTPDDNEAALHRGRGGVTP